MTLETDQQGQLVRWVGNREPLAKKRKAPDESDEAQKRLRVQPQFPAIYDPQEVAGGLAMQNSRDEQSGDGDVEMGDAPEMEDDPASNSQLAVVLRSNNGFPNDQSSNSQALGAVTPFSNRHQPSFGNHDPSPAPQNANRFTNQQSNTNDRPPAFSFSSSQPPAAVSFGSPQGSTRNFSEAQQSPSSNSSTAFPRQTFGFGNHGATSLSHDHRAAGNGSAGFNNRQLAPFQRLETIEESSSHFSEVSQYQAPRSAATGTLGDSINQRRAVQHNFSSIRSVTSRTRNERTVTSRQYNPGGYDEVTERTVTENEGEILAGFNQSGQFVSSSNMLPSRSQHSSLQHSHPSPGFDGSLSTAGDLNDYLRFLAERGGQRRNGF
ncbi:hypothetical protein S40288_05112 [Stachybotrys chartarum IBT 40288]|nr:hypothetical protein S40288_05112 [Stachybotrys chartarum IBT 40288]